MDKKIKATITRNKTEIATTSTTSHIKLKLDDLLLQSSDMRTKYRRRQNEVKNTVHWGQRKLFLNELLFLSLFWKREKIKNLVVVYIGAAPGKHILFLASLFPQIEWHLYDPANFTIKPTDKIHIYQKFFTDETAEEWKKNENVFMISDIRSADPMTVGSVKFEQVVQKDMEQQQRWYMIMKPAEAMFKFRLPYPTETLKTFEYLSGYVFKQPWAPQTSTETRLIPIKNKEGQVQKKKWDIIKYEEQMFHLNTVIREETIFQPLFVNGNFGKELVNDFDSNFEILSWIQYLKVSGGKMNVNWKNILALSNLLTSKINRGKPPNEWDTLERIRINPYKIKARTSGYTHSKKRPKNRDRGR